MNSSVFRSHGSLSLTLLLPAALGAVLAVRASAAEGQASAPVPTDVILHGGKVATVDDRFSIHEAVAVTGGKIVEVGTSAAVLRRRGPQTELVDLRGRLVL